MHLRQVFDDLEQFLGTYRGLVSRAGMVLPTEVMHPKGTILDLTIGLRDGLNLIRGRAGVVAVEDRALRGPGRVNLVLRFVDLDPASIDFIERMRGREDAEGVPPFDLEQRLGDPPGPPPEAVATPPPPTRDLPPTGPTTTAETGPTESPGPADPADGLERAVSAALRGRPVAADDEPPAGPPGPHTSRRRWLAWLLVLVVGIPAVVFLGVRAGVIPAFRPVEALPPTPAVPPSPRPTLPAEAAPGAQPPSTTASPKAAPAAGQAPRPTSSAPAKGPATRLDDVVWTTLNGVTEVDLITDHPLRPSQLRAATLADPPRVLIRITGLHRPYPRYRQEVDDGRLQAIRAWHHADRRPPEQHVVLDLADEEVLVGPPELSGRHVKLRLARAP